MNLGRAQHHGSCVRGRGLTLIEVLIVTVLMAMVASVTMVSLSANDQSARALAMIGHLKDMDARGRMLAQTSGKPMSMILKEDRLMLIATVQGSAAEIITEIGLENFPLRLETTQRVQRITFDRFGHSADYNVVIEGNAGLRQFQVYGLTGVFREVEASP